MSPEQIIFRNPFEGLVNGAGRQAASRSGSDITSVSPRHNGEADSTPMPFQLPSPTSTSPLLAHGPISASILNLDVPPHQRLFSAVQTQPHVVYKGPLRLIRKHVLLNPCLAAVITFLDRVCPPAGGKVVQRDPFIPQIVYMVEYEMEAEDWAAFGYMMRVFGFAAAFHKSLHNSDISEMGQGWESGWAIPQNKPLEDLLAELVLRNRLGFTYDLCKPWEGPRRNAPIPRDGNSGFYRRRH